jgi:hypothetical protein
MGVATRRKYQGCEVTTRSLGTYLDERAKCIAEVAIPLSPPVSIVWNAPTCKAEKHLVNWIYTIETHTYTNVSNT